MEEFNDKKKWTSEFNEAGLQIQRLHYLWATSGNYQQQGDLMKWKWALDRAWIELATDARALDGDKAWRKYEDMPYSSIPAEDRYLFIAQIKKINSLIAMSNNKQALYKALNKKEMLLRQLQERTGKGSKRKQEYDDGW